MGKIVFLRNSCVAEPGVAPGLEDYEPSVQLYTTPHTDSIKLNLTYQWKATTIQNMQREKVTVQKRTIAGKKVKKLRREGTLPANVYGKDIKSVAVQLLTSEFTQLYKKVHETGLVDLELDGKTLPVLIHNVQWSPKDSKPLHADFFKVNLKEKISSSVPVVAVNEPLAVRDKVGVLLTLLNEVEIEALPTDLPEKIEVDVEKLAQTDDQITVGNLQAPAGVTILTDAAQAVFKIGELVTKEAEEEAAADEAAAEAVAGEGAEGETTATDTKNAEESTEEKPKEKNKE